MVGLHSRIKGLVGLHFRRVGMATRMVCLQSIFYKSGSGNQNSGSAI